jgi:hypothetical protein
MNANDLCKVKESAKRVWFLYIYASCPLTSDEKPFSRPLLFIKQHCMTKLMLAFLLLFSFQQGISQKTNKPKLQAMYNAIKAAGIQEPDFVMAQCIQETGWLNCRNCCLRYHNLFGFYIKGNKCKKFKSDEECIEYYKKWQDKRYPKWKKKYPKGTYYDFLKYSKYATGDKYNAEIKPKLAWVRKNLEL